MLKIPSLEFHVMHACNLFCQQCSHYSNLRLGGGVISIKDAEDNYTVWSHRIQPKLFALLGGEPTLNPNLLDHILLAKKHWNKSKLMLVSNGFFLSKHPDLPKVLVKTDCCLEISQHGKDQQYLDEFIKNTEILKEWMGAYPQLKIRTRQSHKGWMRQYHIADNGKPIPYSSKAEEAYSVCMQKTCTQIYKQKLWKCPAIAYFELLDKKMSLGKEWDLFRQYIPLDGDCSEETLHTFFNTKAISQCSLCPFNKESFQHPDPTISDQKLL